MSYPAPLPLYLGEPPCLAWWHGTAGPARVAVLMCPTWGDEELGAHRPLRELALALARAGVAVLRLDLPGEGDSFELLDPDADRPSAWMQTLGLALAELRARSGAPRLVVLGLRLGALLAARLAEDEAAAGRHDVAAVVALLPPRSGRAWLREQCLLGAGQHPTQHSDDRLMVGGFVLNAASAASLQALGWPDPRKPSLPACLWLPRDGLSDPHRPLPPVAWARRTDQLELSGLGSLLAIAHLACWPQGAPAQIVRWVLAQADPVLSPVPAAPTRAARPAAVASQGTVQEQVVYLPGRPARVAVLSRAVTPLGHSQRRGAVLFLSSGAERHIGPHRLWVSLARARAEAGDVVLRLDLAGIGDSDDPPQAADAPMYDSRAVADVADAIRCLRDHGQAGPVTVIGLCSGAYQAWRSALAGLDLQQVVCINPLAFHWQAGDDVNPLQQRFVQQAVSAQALVSLKDPQRWVRLLKGEVHVGVIARAFAGRLQAAAHDLWRNLARRVGQPLQDDLGSELQQVVARGTALHFVFAQGDPGQAVLEGQGGTVWRSLWRTGRAQLHSVARADHTFAGLEGRQELHRLLYRLCSAPRAELGRSPTSSVAATPHQQHP
jgi:alpha-beta hydrolase superfamily lysophospholipase